MKNHSKHFNDFNKILTDAINAGVWIWNVQTGELSINERWAEIIGYTMEELKPISIKTWEQFAHPQDLKTSNAMLETLFNHERTHYECESRMRHKNGQWVYVLDTGRVTEWTDEGKPLIAIGVHIDITERKREQLKAQTNEQYFREIIENTQDIFFRLDLEGTIQYVSPAFESLLGYTPKDAYGQPFTGFMTDEGRKAVEAFLFQDIIKMKHYELYDYTMISKDGWEFKTHTSISWLRENDDIVGYIGLVRDVTKEIQYQQEMEYLSFHDQLTGFKNRHSFERVQMELTNSEHLPLCIMSIDLNNLKTINDTYGHAQGDRAIKKSADLLKSVIEDREYLFRMGGDEFLVFIPNSKDTDAEMMKKELSALTDKETTDKHISLAVGYHIVKNPIEKLHEEIAKADEWMYHNKRNDKTDSNK